MKIAIVYNCTQWDYKLINHAVGLAVDYKKDITVDIVYISNGRGHVHIPSKHSVLRNIKKCYPNVKSVLIIDDTIDECVQHYIDIVPPHVNYPFVITKSEKYYKIINQESEEEFDWSTE